MDEEKSKKVRVLFLCYKNSCRSQMCEGFAKKLKADSIVSFSAGIEQSQVNPLAIKVMAEKGIDISSHSSKTIHSLREVPFDYVISVCAEGDEMCPVLPGKVKKIRKCFDDPPKLAEGAATEEEALPHYRRVRDEIEEYIASLTLD